MSILLESDRFDKPQSHLDELTVRVTIVFLFVGGMTLLWSFGVDEVLRRLIFQLQPCHGDCMNVYDPAQWSAVRWSTALLLGVASSVPLVLHHLHQFAKPGLLASEYRVLKRWTMVSVAATFLITCLVLLNGLPMLYQHGFAQHTQVGLEAQYNTVHVVMFAVYMVWILWIFAATFALLIIGGMLGVITASTADWYRLRIYGIGVLLMFTTVPDHATSMTIPLIASYLLCSEAVGKPWLNRAPFHVGTATSKFDAEGRRRRFGLLDCSCLGANEHFGFASPNGCTLSRFTGLCVSTHEQEIALEHAMRNGLTDLVVTGCDGGSVPAKFSENLVRLRTELHGLDLMRLRSHRVETVDALLDIDLAMANMHAQALGGSVDRWLVKALDPHGVLPDEVVRIDSNTREWSSLQQRVVMLETVT